MFFGCLPGRGCAIACSRVLPACNNDEVTHVSLVGRQCNCTSKQGLLIKVGCKASRATQMPHKQGAHVCEFYCCSRQCCIQEAKFAGSTGPWHGNNAYPTVQAVKRRFCMVQDARTRFSRSCRAASDLSYFILSFCSSSSLPASLQCNAALGNKM